MRRKLKKKFAWFQRIYRCQAFLHMVLPSLNRPSHRVRRDHTMSRKNCQSGYFVFPWFVCILQREACQWWSLSSRMSQTETSHHRHHEVVGNSTKDTRISLFSLAMIPNEHASRATNSFKSFCIFWLSKWSSFAVDEMCQEFSPLVDAVSLRIWIC